MPRSRRSSESEKSTTTCHSDLASRIAGVPQRRDNDNPLWAGPSAPGPLGGITQSMLVRFMSCRERFRLKYVCGLEPARKWNHRFGYGNMWHACEEALAADVDPLLKLRMHTQHQCSQYPMQVEEICKWANVCGVQFPEYVKYWSREPDVPNRTPLMQEQVFDVPYSLPSGRTVRLRGRWDSVDLIGGLPNPPSGVYLQENKTKGDIDKQQIERQLKFDLQTMLYLVALHSQPHVPWINFNDPQHSDHATWSDEKTKAMFGKYPILGVRYNVVRRPLSGGKGSIKPHSAKSTKNTYTPAESAEQFYERLRADYIAAEPDYWFFRVRAEISPRDVQVFCDTCLDPLLETLCYWYEVVVKGAGFAGYLPEPPPMNYRTPFGVYSALEEGGATEYDAYLETGSEAGLHRTEELFTELQ